MTEETPAEKPSEPSLDGLKAELETLREEVYRAETGRFAQTAKWAGLIGLVISSVLATTAIWDWAFTRAEDRLAENVSRLDAILTDIAQANATIAGTAQTTAQGQAVAQNLNGLKIPLVETALNIVDDVHAQNPEALSSGALIALGYEAGNQARYTDAIRIANMAAEAETTPAFRIEAKRLAAVMAFQTLEADRIAEGRAAMAALAEEAKSVEGLAGFSALSNVLRDWAISEAMLGNCAEAESIGGLFVTDFTHPAAPPYGRAGWTAVAEALAQRGYCS